MEKDIDYKKYYILALKALSKYKCEEQYTNCKNKTEADCYECYHFQFSLKVNGLLDMEPNEVFVDASEIFKDLEK